VADVEGDFIFCECESAMLWSVCGSERASPEAHLSTAKAAWVNVCLIVLCEKQLTENACHALRTV